MKIDLEPGKYVVAVSGGVDSAVLLNLLVGNYQLPTTNYQFVVAHFDHGIRKNSSKDSKFAQDLAKQHNLLFESKREELGPNASEALARKKRYEFLEAIKKKHKAIAIITAHHQDDVIETAIINVVRGTKRRGLISLQSGYIVRPLLDTTKAEIIDYAKQYKLNWREDPSNQDSRYLRNKVRKLLAGVDSKHTKEMLKLISRSKQTNQDIDELLTRLAGDLNGAEIDRDWFIALPYDVSAEVLAKWLRNQGREFDKKDISRLVIALKTGKIGTRYDIDKNFVILLQNKQISLQRRQSV